MAARHRGTPRRHRHVATLAFQQELQSIAFAPMHWTVDDIHRLRPDLPRHQAAVFLHRVEDQLHERVTNYGDRVLRHLLRNDAALLEEEPE